MKKYKTWVLLLLLFMGFSSVLAVEPEVQSVKSQIKPALKPEIQLYLEAQPLEKSQQFEAAAMKYQEALFINPSFALARKQLNGLSRHILTDHRKPLAINPGYTIKPSSHDPKAIAGPYRIEDVMPGYLMVYRHADAGTYGVFSLNSRFMHNIHYLLVKEDETWQKYPSISLPGVTRVNNTLVYHQPGETIQEGFIHMIVTAYLRLQK